MELFIKTYLTNSGSIQFNRKVRKDFYQSSMLKRQKVRKAEINTNLCELCVFIKSERSG
jgi:hypothetical protein